MTHLGLGTCRHVHVPSLLRALKKISLHHYSPEGQILTRVWRMGSQCRHDGTVVMRDGLSFLCWLEGFNWRRGCGLRTCSAFAESLSWQQGSRIHKQKRPFKLTLYHGPVISCRQTAAGVLGDSSSPSTRVRPSHLRRRARKVLFS